MPVSHYWESPEDPLRIPLELDHDLGRIHRRSPIVWHRQKGEKIKARLLGNLSSLSEPWYRQQQIRKKCPRHFPREGEEGRSMASSISGFVANPPFRCLSIPRYYVLLVSLIFPAWRRISDGGRGFHEGRNCGCASHTHTHTREPRRGSDAKRAGDISRKKLKQSTSIR